MRWATPSMLVVAMLVFLLPWVEVQCEPRGPQPFGGYTVADQSGLQACWGGYSDNLNDPRFRGRIPGQPGQPGNPFVRDQLKVPSESAPLVIVYAVLLVLATALGFAMPPGVARYSLVGTSLGLALAVLIVQTVLGFPLMNYLKGPGVLDRLGEQMLGDDARVHILTVRYGLGFYVTYAMLGAGVICLLVEIGNPPRPERARRRREDDWDDEDDYDDERRRRSRPPPRDGPRYDF